MSELSRSKSHDLRHVVCVDELVAALFECVADFKEHQNHTDLNQIPIRIATGPGKQHVHLISSIYYSPESKSIWIDVEK